VASSDVISVLDIVKIGNVCCNMKWCDTQSRQTDRQKHRSRGDLSSLIFSP